MLLDSGSDLNERIKHLEAKNLALREEVEAVKCENQAMIPYVELVDKLKADNEALREDYKEANVLLNGYDKLLTKLRDRRDKDQEEIRKFHADNEALRARVGILDNMPSSGTGGRHA